MLGLCSHLVDMFPKKNTKVLVVNIISGGSAWSERVYENFDWRVKAR